MGRGGTPLAALAALVLAGCGGTIKLDTGLSGTGPDPTGPTGSEDSEDTDTGAPDTETDTDTGPRDDDGDGYYTPEDCDDGDPDVNPGQDEVADGVDNDCNGWVDDWSVCATGGADYAGLQEAVDAVADGATLLVCPGVYEEHVVIGNKTLHIEGTEGAASTIVDATSSGRGFDLTNGADVTLVGLTVRNGLVKGDIGGCIQCSGATMALRQMVVADGSAGDGGGVGARNCEVAIEDTEVANGFATTYGGNVYLSQSSGTVSECTLWGGEANEGGGIAILAGSVAVTGSVIRDNLATTVDEELHWHGGGGGGLWTSSDADIRGNVIADNESMYNGGGVFLNYSGGVIADNEIRGNLCHEDGGGLYSNEGDGDILDNVFAENEALDDAGGLRIYVGMMDVEGNQFSANVAADDGGGLKLSHSANSVVDNEFVGNVTGDAGGGAEFDNDTTYLAGNLFFENQATRGAGMHTWQNEGPMTLEDNVYEDNVATDCGGGIQVDNDAYQVTVRNSQFEDNIATDGAAICFDKILVDIDDDDIGDVWWHSNVKFFNVLIHENAASDDGGALYTKTGVITMVNTTIHDNSAPNGSAFAVKEDSTVVVSNSIVSNNPGGDGVWVEPVPNPKKGEVEGTIAFTYSDFWQSGGFSGTADPIGVSGNIALDPEYVDADLDDYALSPGSPCIDAGNPTISDVDGTRSDMGWTGGPGFAM